MKKLIVLVFVFCALSVSAADLQITELAKKENIKTCLPTITSLEQFLTKDTSYGTYSTWSKANADKTIFNSSIELTYSDGAALVDFVVVPTADGKCAYSYTRTWHSSKSCIAISKEDFMKDFEYKGDLNKEIAIFNKKGVKVLLMPVGSNCIIQKKEIDFDSQ